jgi:hypothetical protein
MIEEGESRFWLTGFGAAMKCVSAVADDRRAWSAQLL